MKIDEGLADLGSRRAVLKRDQRELSRRITDLEASIARAVVLGAPSDGIAEAHQDLRQLKEEQASVSAALESIAHDAEKLTSQAAPRGVPGAVIKHPR